MQGVRSAGRAASRGGRAHQRQFGPTGAASSGEKPSKYPSVLHLRSGDNIRCSVTKIDERGVTLVTAAADATFVPNDQVMALELMVDSRGAGRLPKTKQERLLMTPRMQRASPPTHLIRSTSGDYLRGRLVALDDLQLEMEIRLESKTIPRTTVARIIWLHPEAPRRLPRPSNLPPVKSGCRRSTRRQTPDDVRRKLCRHRPSRAITTCSGNAASTSTESTVVSRLGGRRWPPRICPSINGSPACAPDPLGILRRGRTRTPPPIRRWSASRLPSSRSIWSAASVFAGTIIAARSSSSTFGPPGVGPACRRCRRSTKLPRNSPTRAFVSSRSICRKRPTRSSKRSTSCISRPSVALDVDGAVAKKYGATAIPQTVIVGRDGNVARVFVGGSSHFDEQLRSAVESVWPARPPRPSDRHPRR